MAKPKSQKTFRQRMDRLGEIVEALEGGELDLEEAIARFEEGRHLHGDLLRELGAYEERLDALVEGADGALETTPLASPDGDEDHESRAR